MNNGLIVHDSGTFTVTGFVANNSGGRLFAARPLIVGGTFTNSAGARLTLEERRFHDELAARLELHGKWNVDMATGAVVPVEEPSV